MKRAAALALSMLLLCCCSLTSAQEATLLDSFTASTGAQTLDLGSVKVEELETLEAFLDCFPNLQHVDMFATPVRARQIAELTERYPGVTFGWTIRISEHTVRTDATAFSTLHMSGSPIHTSQELSLLQYCTELRALDIGHNGVDDLSFLYALPKLKVLIIACNQVQDLTPLASLKELEYLELFSNKVTDLTPLAGLSQLLDLNIGYNQITDFSPLYGLSGLERLWIYKSVPKALRGEAFKQIAAEVAAALPDTYVDAKNVPTGGGWREHPRFETIHAMFASGVYMPFEAAEESESAR